MKTYLEIRNEVISRIEKGEITRLNKYTFSEIETAAAKEYAKQWVEKAATDAKGFIGLAENCIDETVFVAQKSFEEIKKQIDAQ